MSSREKILKSIKQAVKVPSNLPGVPDNNDNEIKNSLESITPKNLDGLRDQFAQELKAVSGDFVSVANEKELIDHLKDDLKANNHNTIAVMEQDDLAEKIKKIQELECINTSDLLADDRKNKLANTQASLVGVNYAIADVASLVVLLDETSSLFPHYLPDNIYVIVKPDQLLANMFELMETVPADKSKNMLLITGPSRTADIEKILILGAHGPRKLTVYWLQS